MQLNNKKQELLIEKLNDVKKYLLENNYNKDAQRIEKITFDISTTSSRDTQYIVALKRLIAMTNVRYLGDVMIAEFDSPYDWMNYLSEISDLAEELINSVNK